jgi:hypothetical protein
MAGAVLALAIAPRDGLAELAAGAGYADQAHLARDCRALAGATLAGLVAARRPPAAGTRRVSETSKTVGGADARMGA